MSAIKENPEVRIVDFVTDLESKQSLRDYYAIIFNLSKLLERNKSDYQINIAINILYDLNRKNNNKIFLCRNRDVIVIFEAQNRDFVEKMIYQLRYLFIDDKLAFKRANVENPDFASVYVLIFQKQEFLQLFKSFTDEKVKEKRIELLDEKKMLFGQIEEDLQKINIGKLIRESNAAIFIQDRPVNKIFSEYYISISQLRDLLGYDINLYNNKLTYLYMKSYVHEKILEEISNNVQNYASGAININLDPEVVLSDLFVDFHKNLRSYTNVSVIIDFDVSDIFYDLTGFSYACNFLKELGYKICVDGLDVYNIIHLNPETLGADFIKILYNSEDGAIDRSIMKQTISKFNRNRVILVNCFNDEALNYGKDLGIHIYQGIAVEKKLP